MDADIPGKPLQIIGLKRTGTTYLAAILRQLSFIKHVYREPYWKKDINNLIINKNTLIKTLYDHQSEYKIKYLYDDFYNICVIREDIFETCLSLAVCRARGFFHTEIIYTKMHNINMLEFKKILDYYYEWYNRFLDDILDRKLKINKLISYEDLTFDNIRDIEALGFSVTQLKPLILNTKKSLPKNKNIQNLNTLRKIFEEKDFTHVYQKIKSIKGLQYDMSTSVDTLDDRQ